MNKTKQNDDLNYSVNIARSFETYTDSLHALAAARVMSPAENQKFSTLLNILQMVEHKLLNFWFENIKPNSGVFYRMHFTIVSHLSKKPDIVTLDEFFKNFGDSFAVRDLNKLPLLSVDTTESYTAITTKTLLLIFPKHDDLFDQAMKNL